MARENFYLLLDLDPTVDDWKTIETRLQEKRRAWSRDRSQGNPKARRRAERHLHLLPEIESVLKDPETRRQEAKEARKRRQEILKERLRELDEAIGLIRSSGGTCDRALLEKLVRRFDRTLSEAEIKKRLRAAGVELAGTGPKRQHRAKEQIDKVTASAIRRDLEHLGLASLYQFLDLRPQSSPRALADRADEIYKENQRLGKTDADASAQNELAGLCKKLFRDEGEKEKYDNTLALEAMEGLKDNLELAGSDRIINRAELDDLVRQARQRGVSAEDARAYIEDYAAKRKWGVQSDAELESVDGQDCGFCGALAPSGARQCPGCGEALEIPCPRCGTENPTHNAACTACGCLVGDAPLVKGLMKEAERLALEGAFVEALRHLDKALHYWPEWQPAIDARRRIEGRRTEREGELAAIEQQVRSRRLAAARSALERFERQWGNVGLKRLRRRIENGLAKAQTAFHDGERRRRSDDLEAALDHFDQALAACVDFEPALTALSANPPPQPDDLEVRPLAKGFRLSWPPAGSHRSGARHSVSYRVRRKAGGAPRSPEDGADLGEVHGTRLDDLDAIVGEACYYAVFTTRSGVASRQAACSGPHLRTAEVAGLEAVAGHREATLHWQRPTGCRRVRVWRSSPAAPGRPGDGTELTLAGDSLHDTGLINGRQYGYRIVACFADPQRSGDELRTRGETVTVTPVAPPAAVTDLRASRQGRTVMLTWTPVNGAIVQLRQSAQAPEHTPGQIIAVSQLDRFGTPIAGASAGSAQIICKEQGRIHVVPLSITGGTAVAGEAVEVTHLDPVTELEARRVGGSILLTWNWPPGLEEVAVCHAQEGYPEDPCRQAGARVRITRRQYERGGGWMLRRPEQVPHYFSVFAKAGEDLYAPAAHALVGMGRAASVAYRVVVKKRLLRRSVEDAWLELTLKGAGGHLVLPELLVIGKSRQVPLSPRDGEVMVEVPSLSFGAGVAGASSVAGNSVARIPIPPRYWPGDPYVKLFFKDAAQAREIRLLPAAKERLRIS